MLLVAINKRSLISGGAMLALANSFSFSAIDMASPHCHAFIEGQGADSSTSRNVNSFPRKLLVAGMEELVGFH